MNNIMKANIINQCTSCQMCASVCPRDAIKIELDNNGFYTPVIDERLCIECGQCLKVCYKFDTNVIMSDKYKMIYAAATKDLETLETTTSGGIAYELAMYLLEEGYKICGVSYDYKEDIAITEIAQTREELIKFKGSKYIQTLSKRAFKSILKDNSNEKYAVFGLPCHIYALNRALLKRKRREDYVLIDLFCHGCPSMDLWKKDIKEIKKKYDISNPELVEFRSKSKGWHEFCIRVEDLQNQYIGKSTMDFFYTFFFDNQILNKACYDCKLRSTLEYTDIRLGDFWGQEYDKNTTGMSAIVCITEVGNLIFESMSKTKDIKTKKYNLNDIIKAQSYKTTYMLDNTLREYAFELLKSNMNTIQIKKLYIKKWSIKKKVKYRLKQCYQFLPQNIRYSIKSIYHKGRGR